MRVSRFLAVVFMLALFFGAWTNLGLADQTQFTLKYSWPRLDVERMPASAMEPEGGVGAFEASINVWQDRLGLLTSFEMGEFEFHGISGTHIVSPGTAAQRVYDYDSYTDVVKGVFNCDMRIYLGNFFRRWSEAELKVLRDMNLAVVLGWNWQHYKFDRNVVDINVVGHPNEEADKSLLPWNEATGYAVDHGGAYKIVASGPELGFSLDWSPFEESKTDALKQIGMHFLSRFSPGILRAHFYGVKWQNSLESISGADCEAGVTYDFAKLLDLKGGQSLTAGLGGNMRLLSGHGFNRITSYGGLFTVSYGMKHTW
ncbi:MAG TPA: hypothetical protein VM163_09850 [bacterium]|nr:hypothetical protein [bacterium]